MADQQIACAQQQIDEIERARAALQLFVSRERARELLAQQRREVGVGRALKFVELVHQRFIGGPHGVALDAGAVSALAAAPGAPEVPVLREIDRARFPAVVIGHAEAHDGVDLVRELADRPGIEKERIPRRRGRARTARRTRGSCAIARPSAASRSNGSRRHAPSKSRHSASSRAARRSRSIGPSALSRPSGDHTLRLSARLHARRRILEPLVEPAAKRVGKQALGARLGEHVEQRIHARFDRTFAQQIGAEAVDRADVRFFEPLDRVGQVRVNRRGSAARWRAVSSSCLIRSFNSPAAFSVNVTATI